MATAPIPNDLITLFEDEWLIAVHKPSGLLSHSNPGREDEDSLENRLRAQAGNSIILFHRLDRDSSGIVLLGKRREIAGRITQDFEQKKIRKSYFAVVEGEWQPHWNKIEAPIQSQDAMTTFRLLSANHERSWIEALPKTGRQHQIRLHCASVQRPIMGDKRYGAAHEDGEGIALHAYRLDFRHPKSLENIRILCEPTAHWRSKYLRGLDVSQKWSQLFPEDGEVR